MIARFDGLLALDLPALDFSSSEFSPSDLHSSSLPAEQPCRHLVGEERDLRRVFGNGVEKTPRLLRVEDLASNISLILRPDFSVCAVSAGYLAVSQMSIEEVLGKEIFQVFPYRVQTSASLAGSDSVVTKLRATFDRLRSLNCSRVMSVHCSETLLEKKQRVSSWNSLSAAVRDQNDELLYIIHCLEEIEPVTEHADDVQSIPAEVPKFSSAARHEPPAAVDSQLSISNFELGFLCDQITALLSQTEHETFEQTQPPPPVLTGEVIQRPRAILRRLARLVHGHKQLEAALRQTQDLQNMGRLAGGIIHDFNNMLAIIHACAELLKMQLNGSPALESVDELKRATAKASALSGQLLALLRKEGATPRTLDLNGIIGGLQKLLFHLFDKKILLTLELDEALEKIFADEHGIERIVMNLAVNARDAMPAGGELLIKTETVTVEAGEMDRVNPGRHVRLTVRDTGCGMSKETLDRMFEPFYSTKGQGKGTGLGLAIVKEIIDATGGAIQVSSIPGRGTAFEIYLPLATPQQLEFACGPEKPLREKIVVSGRSTA